MDLALQSAEAPGTTLNNGIMAGRAGHPFWLQYMQLMAARAGLVASGLLRDGDRILNSTGPQALTDTFLAVAHLQPGDFLPGEHQLNGSLFQVYPVGSWFQPCACRDTECQDRTDWLHIKDPWAVNVLVVGNHLCLASWLTALKARNRIQLVLVAAGLLVLAAAGLYLWVSCAGQPASRRRMRDRSKA